MSSSVTTTTTTTKRNKSPCGSLDAKAPILKKKKKKQTEEIVIGLIGCGSSGKSTLINKIVGYDILVQNSSLSCSPPIIIQMHYAEDYSMIVDNHEEEKLSFVGIEELIQALEEYIHPDDDDEEEEEKKEKKKKKSHPFSIQVFFPYGNCHLKKYSFVELPNALLLFDDTFKEEDKTFSKRLTATIKKCNVIWWLLSYDYYTYSTDPQYLMGKILSDAGFKTPEKIRAVITKVDTNLDVIIKEEEGVWIKQRRTLLNKLLRTRGVDYKVNLLSYTLFAAYGLDNLFI